jgi:hypothetical protein
MCSIAMHGSSKLGWLLFFLSSQNGYLNYILASCSSRCYFISSTTNPILTPYTLRSRFPGRLDPLLNEYCTAFICFILGNTPVVSFASRPSRGHFAQCPPSHKPHRAAQRPVLLFFNPTLYRRPILPVVYTHSFILRPSSFGRQFHPWCTKPIRMMVVQYSVTDHRRPTSILFSHPWPSHVVSAFALFARSHPTL